MWAAYFGLAAAAFLAATPLPMNSEVVFLAMQAGGYSPLALVVVATVANVAGSCITYFCGIYAEKLRGSRWFPLPEAGLEKAQNWFRRWGLWSLLLAWAPGGDVLVGVAGLMRVPFWQFLALVTLSKALRYIVVAAIAAGAFQALLAAF